MKNILDQIIAYKREEIRVRRLKVTEDQLKGSRFYGRETISLRRSLEEPSSTGIIAEFKRRSPSRGIINRDANVADVTGGYTRSGAAALSVLTDDHFFGGSSDDLISARTNQIPILRKDFVIDEYQILESRAIGADAILLIAACLEPRRVEELAAFARSIQLEVLLEIHNEEELEHICPEAGLVGVNNRDLKTFTVDLNRSVELAGKIPVDKVRISESGISDPGTIARLRSYGYQGFLLGEHFMKDENPTMAFASFVNKLKETVK
jgi:indole-3-glycerol phosphate synthase